MNNYTSFIIGVFVAAGLAGLTKYVFPKYMPILDNWFQERLKIAWYGKEIESVVLGFEHLNLRKLICLPDVRNKKIKRLILSSFSKNLGKVGVVRDKDFEEICNEFLNSFEEVYKRVGFLSKRIAFYLPDNLKEVWIACEPPFEILNNEHSSFGLLEKQLKTADKVRFFFSKRNRNKYSTIIKKKIESDSVLNEHIAKIEFSDLKEPLSQAVVLYFREMKDNKIDCYGFTAKTQPCIIEKDGCYVMEKQFRDKDFEYLEHLESQAIIKEIEKRLI